MVQVYPSSLDQSNGDGSMERLASSGSHEAGMSDGSDAVSEATSVACGLELARSDFPSAKVTIVPAP